MSDENFACFFDISTISMPFKCIYGEEILRSLFQIRAKEQNHYKFDLLCMIGHAIYSTPSTGLLWDVRREGW